MPASTLLQASVAAMPDMSPQGNLLCRAVKWLENRGVVATYLVGDQGTGMLRSWRHLPGAANHLQPVKAPLKRGDQLEMHKRFAWYAMTELADVSWLLPKARLARPSVKSGKASVDGDSSHCIITVAEGRTASFTTVRY